MLLIAKDVHRILYSSIGWLASKRRRGKDVVFRLKSPRFNGGAAMPPRGLGGGEGGCAVGPLSRHRYIFSEIRLYSQSFYMYILNIYYLMPQLSAVMSATCIWCSNNHLFASGHMKITQYNLKWELCNFWFNCHSNRGVERIVFIWYRFEGLGPLAKANMVVTALWVCGFCLETG